MKSSSHIRWIFLSLATAATVCLLTEVALYSQNTLYLNSNWIVSKRNVHLALMGSDEFLLSRTPLANNQLNLGTWCGFQEVLFQKPIQPIRSQFRFLLKDKAYLHVVLGKTDSGFSGFRLSRHSDFKPIFFTATAGGEFRTLEPLPDLLLENGWHTATLDLTKNRLNITVDESPYFEKEIVFPQGFMGFRGGSQPVLIDDVQIETPDGIFFETFRNTTNLLRTLFLMLAITSLSILGVATVSFLSHSSYLFLLRSYLMLFLALSFASIYYGAVSKYCG